MLMSDSSVTRLYTPLEIWERKYKEGIKSTWAKHLDLLKVSLYDSVQFSSVLVLEVQFLYFLGILGIFDLCKHLIDHINQPEQSFNILRGFTV